MQPTISQHSNPALSHRARHMARHIHIWSPFCTTQRTRRLIRSIVSSNETHLRMWFGATTQLKSHQITTLNAWNHNSETQYSLPQWASKQRKCLGHFCNKTPTAKSIHSSRKGGRIWFVKLLGFWSPNPKPFPTGSTCSLTHRDPKVGHVFAPIHPKEVWAPRAQRTWSA